MPVVEDDINRGRIGGRGIVEERIAADGGPGPDAVGVLEDIGDLVGDLVRLVECACVRKAGRRR
jgi:hypothetical protein